MPPRLSSDPDMLLFSQTLQRLPAGKKYLEAWRELLAAERRLRSITIYRQTTTASALDHARRNYIRRLDECDQALWVMRRLYNWPQD